MIFMTRVWPAGDPIHVTTGADGLPQAFLWRGRWHQVAGIANRWRVQSSWWSPQAAAWREYFKLTTDDGLLCTLYRDMESEGWFFARLFD
jgi:hypothetical protein